MDYARPATEEAVQRVTESLKARNIDVIVVKDREEALNKIKELVSPGSEVFPGTSVTLDAIGYSAFLKGNKEYTNLRDVAAAEPDPAKRALLRRRNAIADYFVGSVHAIAETGQVVAASMTGSQVAAYVGGARRVVWVAGTNKIVPTLEDAIRRVREHSLPLEDQRMKSIGAAGSSIGKLVIFEREAQAGRITLLLVKESLGF